MCREEESSDDDSEDSFARDDALQFEADEGGAQEQMAAAPKGDVDMLLDNFRMKVPPEPATAPKNPSYTQFLQSHFTQQQIEELHLKQRQKEAEEQARVLRLQAEQRQAVIWPIGLGQCWGTARLPAHSNRRRGRPALPAEPRVQVGKGAARTRHPMAGQRRCQSPLHRPPARRAGWR